MTIPTVSVGARVRVIDTSLYGPQHDVGTLLGRDAGQVLVEFICRCRVAGAQYGETARAPHALWFPEREVEPA